MDLVTDETYRIAQGAYSNKNNEININIWKNKRKYLEKVNKGKRCSLDQ